MYEEFSQSNEVDLDVIRANLDYSRINPSDFIKYLPEAMQSYKYITFIVSILVLVFFVHRSGCGE